MVLGTISGIVSAGSVFCFLGTLFWLPGLLFGLIVAVPWSRASQLTPPVSLMIAVLSVIGYFLATFLATQSRFVLSPVAGGLGVAIMLSPAFRPVWDSLRKTVAMTVVAGALASFVFFGFSFVPEGWWGMLIGIAVWQAITAATLSSSLKARS